MPTEEIIASTESLARRLDRSEPGRGTLLRRRVQKCLEESKQPSSNLPRNEIKALTTLAKDQSIVILPSDKGRATVILNTEDYKDKLQQLLKDGSYQKLKRDPTKKIERRINDDLRTFERQGEITEQHRSKLSPASPSHLDCMDYQKSTKRMSHAVQLCHQLVPQHTRLPKKLLVSSLHLLGHPTATSGIPSTLLRRLGTLHSTAVIN